jgi:hypothetical protein
MSFTRVITAYDSKIAKYNKAKEVNERRRQAQAFLKRTREQKKSPINTKEHA